MQFSGINAWRRRVTGTPVKIMLSILGEGRGHMTQAMAVKEMVEKAGHEVVGVTLGTGANRTPPAYFVEAMKMPVMTIPTLEFSYKDNARSTCTGRWPGSRGEFPLISAAIGALQAVVREHRPDVIINFFEALTGLYALTCRRRPPVVAVAHQFMFGHPDYVRAPGLRLQQLGMKRFVQMVGARLDPRGLIAL